MKLITIIGARPQFIKAAAVSREIAKCSEIREIIIHTGQHFEKNMSQIFFQQMHIPKPDYNLEINSLSHGALLPKYRGKLPSFWVLANGESKTGVTIHYMNKELDDGPIIIQKEVDINDDDTLHSLVLRSKVNFGALALAEAVSQIMQGKVVLQKNDSAKATYYSFPTTEAVKEFRKRGRKFR